jgi:lipopolysaccharide heptosyltransferase II
VLEQLEIAAPPEHVEDSARVRERVLVKAVNWLGDLVMSLPACRAVRRAFPDAHLSVLVRRELAGFFAASAWVDEVVPYRIAPGWPGIADRRRLVADLRERRFDVAVLFPKSFEAAFWAALAGAGRRIGFATDARSLLLTRRVRFGPELLAAHQVHDHLHLVREAFGVAGDAADCRPDVDPEQARFMGEWIATRRRSSGPLVALAVAAAYGPAKEWPESRYAELIDLLHQRHGAECVLVGSPGERAKCEEVARRSQSGALVAAGETDVGAAVALLSLVDAFAGNDSGSMHVAGALGIPTVGLFGSTDPRRTAPLGPRTRVLRHPIECSPCLERTCRFGHYDCLGRIQVDDVARALEELGAFRSAELAVEASPVP